MPKRLLLLAALYVIAFFGLAGLMLVPFEDALIADDSIYVGDLAYLLLFFVYLTVTVPLGLWGALGKTPLAARLVVSIVPAFLLATWVALNPVHALLQEFLLDQGTWREFPAYVVQSGATDLVLWTLTSGLLLFLLFLAPTALGGVWGRFAKRRGLHVAMPGEWCGGAVVTRFSLHQLFLLMLGVSALLAIQPILAAGISLGEVELPPEILAAKATSIEMQAFSAQLEPAELEALINSGAVVEFDFGLDDDVAYDEPSAAETIVQTASTAVAMGTPFVLASMIGLWAMLFAESPWRRMIWGAPFAIASGGLLAFHDNDLLSVMVTLAVFLAAQAAVLWVVRSTGYRLAWSPTAGVVSAEVALPTALMEPAIA